MIPMAYLSGLPSSHASFLPAATRALTSSLPPSLLSGPVQETSWATVLTIGLAALRRLALPHAALVLEINVPAVGVAGGVLQREGEDGAAFLDRVLAARVVGRQRGVDGVEGRGGGEGVCGLVSSRGREGRLGVCGPFLRDIVGDGLVVLMVVQRVLELRGGDGVLRGAEVVCGGGWIGRSPGRML